MPDAIIHVIDDDEAMRDSLQFLLISAGFSAQAHASADAFVAEIDDAASGCVVTDIRMPGMQGIDLVRHLQGRDQTLPVIVMTGHGDVPLAVEAMKAGAFDFLEKPFDDEALLGCVRAALASRAKDAGQAAKRAAARAALATLTAREAQVLEGLVAGKPNKTIAFDLGISPRTVEIYRANVMSKLNAASLPDLVRMALLTERG